MSLLFWYLTTVISTAQKNQFIRLLFSAKKERLQCLFWFSVFRFSWFSVLIFICKKFGCQIWTAGPGCSSAWPRWPQVRDKSAQGDFGELSFCEASMKWVSKWNWRCKIKCPYCKSLIGELNWIASVLHKNEDEWEWGLLHNLRWSLTVYLLRTCMFTPSFQHPWKKKIPGTCTYVIFIFWSFGFLKHVRFHLFYTTIDREITST